MDAYGYNTVEFLSSGPLVRKIVDSVSKTSIAKVGYLVGGTLNLRKDGDPSAIGVWKVNDDVLADIQQNPLRPSAVGSGFISRSAFLGEDDISKVKVKPNVESISYNFNGKLSWLLTDNVFVTVGGRARRFSGNDYRHEYSLLNFENNSEFINETYAGYARLRQSFESSEGALIQNAGYTVQFDYTHFQNTRWDPGHTDNVFNYGHVGQFDVYQTQYQFQSRQINEGTDGAFNLFALYEQETPMIPLFVLHQELPTLHRPVTHGSSSTSRIMKLATSVKSKMEMPLSMEPLPSYFTLCGGMLVPHTILIRKRLKTRHLSTFLSTERFVTIV